MKVNILLILTSTILLLSSFNFLQNNKSIIGIWTDGSSENATFEINKSTIFYIDSLKEFKYKLKKDSLFIFYDDYTFKGKIKISKDTLFITNGDVVRKYWEFKN
ncbi:MAG: hypothetical protein ACOVLG_02075 [Flavobacterium sp.]